MAFIIEKSFLHSVMNKIALDFVKNSYHCNFSKYFLSGIFIFFINRSFSQKTSHSCWTHNTEQQKAIIYQETGL